MAEPKTKLAQSNPPERSIRQRLRDYVSEVRYTDKYGNSETQTGEDSPTGKPIVYINDKIYRTPAVQERMIAAESIHLLKHVDPERFKDLMDTAKNDPVYMAGAEHSYKVVTGEEADEHGIKRTENLEERDFAPWHRSSRFDQFIGGYINAGDPEIPTMRGWNRETMRMGPELRSKLEAFRQEFNEPSKLGRVPLDR